MYLCCNGHDKVACSLYTFPSVILVNWRLWLQMDLFCILAAQCSGAAGSCLVRWVLLKMLSALPSVILVVREWGIGLFPNLKAILSIIFPKICFQVQFSPGQGPLHFKAPSRVYLIIYHYDKNCCEQYWLKGRPIWIHVLCIWALPK